MNLIQPCLHILAQLNDLIRQVSDDDFSRPSDVLNGSTLGQHLRHTLEFFICLERGFSSGIVNYDKRAHDKMLETDRLIAMSTIDGIMAFITGIEGENAALKLEVGYDTQREEYIRVETNVMRELIYNIEHAVHHMAIMKIGIREIAPYVELPGDFGVAASTVRHKQSVHASREE